MLHPIIADNIRPDSAISVPKSAHPLVRLLFMLMRKHGTRYDILQDASGVLRQTFRSWRTDKFPGIRALSATLGCYGYRLLPCPPLDDLPAHVRDQLEEIGQHFFSDDEALAACVYAATSKPWPSEGRAPRVDLKARDWEAAA